MVYNRDLAGLLKGKAELAGFADMQALETAWPEIFEHAPVRFPYAVSIGKALNLSVLETVRGKPNPLYFSHYRQVNYLLDRLTLTVADFIEEKGYRALPIPASQVLSRTPMTAHICHRRVVWQAGLGTRGLNNLLVNEEFGSAVRYATVLTDIPVEPGAPVDNGCDSCGICIRACPAGAIGTSPEEFDLDKCRAKLDEFRKIPFVSQHICGVCLRACPGSRAAGRNTPFTREWKSGRKP
jgi:epoxyqueuosine reductase QueG